MQKRYTIPRLRTGRICVKRVKALLRISWNQQLSMQERTCSVLTQYSLMCLSKNTSTLRWSSRFL